MKSIARPNWNEESLSELPAAELLEKLGYDFVEAEVLDSERESLREPILTSHLKRALKKLNPWLSAENAERAAKSITRLPSSSLAEASEKAHVLLTFGDSLEQDLGNGKRHHSVKFIDFDTPSNNEFIFTRQYKVHGTKQNIRPDLVVFVNGLPLAVIECKSPTIGEKWLDEAIRQVIRYQGLSEDNVGGGASKLFETTQLIIVTCGQKAYYGTVGTPFRFWAEWKQPYPISEDELEKLLGRKPQNQDIALYGLLEKQNLLDLTKNFVVYEREGGRSSRKMCRYKQFIAVNRAIHRIHTSKSPKARGGVIWHTQGSGKSLTMLWLALKLRRDPTLNNPTFVVATDRIDLDKQISSTFLQSGFPNPEQANSAAHLRELLSGPPGKTVMTTVQKFQEISGEAHENSGGASRTSHPTFSSADNIFVLVDEAHRTQYNALAANMRKALPNACFIGFTGTPIDKDDRSTLSTFGSYIDTYTIEQAVADGATVPIFYESRLPELRIIGHSLDKVFDHVFADRTDEERAAIRKKFATEDALASAPKRIEAICLDLIEHFNTAIKPNGFKAQVVACSREAAVTYQETLIKLNGPPSALIISTGHNDPDRFLKFAMSKEKQSQATQAFKDPKDPLAILVVCDMLLTGFDAPVEQVMYLDSPLKEHTLLQAIARVNRKADNKSHGLVVDYWGVSDDLQNALRVFSPSDVHGALLAKFDELPRLQARHAAAMRYFHNKTNLEECVLVLEPDDVRAEFDAAFKSFAKSLDMLLPDPRALPYRQDLIWLGKIRGTAQTRFEGKPPDIGDCGAKVRKLIEEAVIAEGIQILVKEVSIFSSDFDDKVNQLRSPESQASEMEHALKHEIHVHMDENPAFYGSLLEKLEKLIEARQKHRMEAAKRLELLKGMLREIRSVSNVAAEAGMDEFAHAVYGLLEPSFKVAEPRVKYDAGTKELAELLVEAIQTDLKIIDWSSKENVQKVMRQKLKKQLLAGRIEPSRIENIAQGIVNLARAREKPR